MFFKAPTTHHSPPTTRGLTLVEMLISMAVTLVMMAAVVNLFANIGAGVRNRRASMELGSQLRLARARLFKDLAGATCAVRPKLPSDDHDDGYLEIIEGPWSDSQPSPMIEGGPPAGDMDFATSGVPSSNLPLAAGNVTDGLGLGDKDNVLMLTVRSESEPFVGRYVDPATGQVQTIESDLAEVIWYLVENPNDGLLGEPGMRTLYRRVLLIAPWVTLPSLNNVNIPGVIPSMSAQDKVLAYYRNYDISAQIYPVLANGNLDDTPDPTLPLVPNTLSDLTKRENRFAHSNWTDTPTPAMRWPYTVDLHVAFVPFDADQFDTTNPPPNRVASELVSPLRPFGHPFEPSGIEPDRKGEDVMLNDVLAFDLRVYDPGAPLINLNGIVLEPSDAGWAVAAANGAPIVGYGAYVDLAWDPSFLANGSDSRNFFNDPKPPRYPFLYNNPPDGVPAPLFKEPHSAGWHPRDPAGVNYGYFATYDTYDTWPYHYEDDGIDQDDLSDGTAGVDQGTNGLDDILSYDLDNDPTTPSVVPTDSSGNQIGIHGVDDSGERETFPPYDHPLRGMQVKIRVYDRDSRQIREATVTRNFVPQ